MNDLFNLDKSKNATGIKIATTYHKKTNYYDLYRVKIDNISYQKPCALSIGVDPLFGRLEDIFVVNNRVLFHITQLETLYFDGHLQGYVISYTSNNDIILSTQLHYHIPMHIHRTPSLDNNFITIIICKYHIYETFC